MKLKRRYIIQKKKTSDGGEAEMLGPTFRQSIE